MTAAEVISQLRKMGTAQNRKVYARHGVTGPMFGVSYANLGKLQKKIKVDHDLAEALWESGNHDARVLAAKIADPARIKVKQVDRWARESRNHVINWAVAELVAESDIAIKRMEAWTRSKDEWVGTAGWSLLSCLAAEGSRLKDRYLAPFIATIEKKIHSVPNRTRYSMNNALISIGALSPGLEKRAVAAAKRIGKVEVDHGETSCKTPDAAAYILKTVAHRKKKSGK
jgi:3-methyladenine DNA glycosylase AlkD